MYIFGSLLDTSSVDINSILIKDQQKYKFIRSLLKAWSHF